MIISLMRTNKQADLGCSTEYALLLRLLRSWQIDFSHLSHLRSSRVTLGITVALPCVFLIKTIL